MTCRNRTAAAVLLLCLAVWLAGPAYGAEPVGMLPILLRMEGPENMACSGGCTLGAAAADAACYVSGARLAIINGGDLRRNLPPGSVTDVELRAAFAPERWLVVTEVTAAELRALIEHGVSRAVLDQQLCLDVDASAFDGFPQVSGFTFLYDMSAPPGERVYSVTLDDGSAVDREDAGRTYSLCLTEAMAEGGFGYPVLERTEAVDETLDSAFVRWVSEGAPAASDYSGRSRSRAIGCGDDTLLASSPAAVAAVLAVMCLITNGRRFRRKSQFLRP